MGPFLRGFCSELVKTAFVPGETSPMQGVPASGPPTSQRPIGAAAAPPRPGENASGQQVMNVRGPEERSTWRPSPKYSPKPDAPDPEPAKKRGSGGGGGYRRKGNPLIDVVRDRNTEAPQKQRPDTRTTKEKEWAALPVAPPKPLEGTPDPEHPGSHRMPGTTRPRATMRDITDQARKETENVPLWASERKGGGQAYAKDQRESKDLHRGVRSPTQAENYFSDNPEPQFGTMKNTQFAVGRTLKPMSDKSMSDSDARKFMGGDEAPKPKVPSNNDLMKQWEAGGRQGPKPAMFE